MKKLAVISFLACLGMQACAPAGEVAKAARMKEIDKLGYFTPVSHIGLIDHGNKGSVNELLSKESADMINSLLQPKKDAYRISAMLTPADSELNLNLKLKQEISTLAMRASATRKVEEILLTPTIDSLMEASNERFAIAFVATGFSRAKGNYGGQVAKGIGVGLLTLGMYAPVPIKANSTLHAVIFDSKNNTVTLYNRHQVVDKEPTDPKVLTKQMNSVLTNLFAH